VRDQPAAVSPTVNRPLGCCVRNPTQPALSFGIDGVDLPAIGPSQRLGVFREGRTSKPSASTGGWQHSTKGPASPLHQRRGWRLVAQRAGDLTKGAPLERSGLLIEREPCRSRHCLEAAGIALSIRAFAGLAQVQEPGGAGGTARGRGGLDARQTNDHGNNDEKEHHWLTYGEYSSVAHSLLPAV
jgi:hypothetical protein